MKLSTRSFAAAVTGFPENRGIIPDHQVKPKILDLKKGEDAVLSYTLRLIKDKKQTKSLLLNVAKGVQKRFHFL